MSDIGPKPGDDCPRLHLTIDQRAKICSAMWHIDNALRLQATGQGCLGALAAARSRLDDVLSAPNISGEKGQVNG